METKWLFIAIIAFFVFVVVMFSVGEYAKSQDMKACVAAGKEWKHIKGDIYECTE